MPENQIYFANCINDNISVNLNSSLKNAQLRSLPSRLNEKGTVLREAAHGFETAANPQKGIFGISSGVVNDVRIFSNMSADPVHFQIKIQNYSVQDYYFYIFQGHLIGQSQAGSMAGIEITKLTDAMQRLQ